MNPPYLPQKTANSLASAPVQGTRHLTATNEAIAMLGNGWSSAATFSHLRSKYPEDVTDDELRGIIAWAESKPLQPSTHVPRGTFKPSVVPSKKPPKTPQEHAAWWLGGQTMDQASFVALSQLPVPLDRAQALCLALEMLWLEHENLNILTTHIEEAGKAKPHGMGRIASRGNWVEYIQTKGVPESRAGAWIRPNPCKAQGTGIAGAVTDSDITTWRFILLESDILPLPVQLALFAKLKLPILAVIMSGGISAHAWVRLDSTSAVEFSETARRLLVALQPFGIDQANKNPSRLSRLPSANRIIGGVNGGIQSLLWLNPARPALTPETLKIFEDSLLLPAIEEKPFKQIVRDSLVRYEELVANRGKLGTPTGFTEFDHDTGGLMPMQMSVVAGETNSGKSTVAVNLINGALMHGHGVALFTLEMGRDEIADMLFSINCRVDRNHFNTGEFTNSEIESMTVNLERLSQLPLWIYDESTLTTTEIRKRILALKADNKIKLAVIDYCQIVMPEGGDSREQEVASIARVLCATAKDAKIALVVLSQLNDERRLRESRVIGHEAHNVFLLENKENENTMIFKVAKGRRIRKKDYQLYYEPIHCLLQSKAKHTTPDRKSTHPDP